MIGEMRGDYPARVLWRTLGVSTSGSNAWLVRKPSARARFRERLKVSALIAHRRMRQTCGGERLRRELAADDFRTSLGTVKSMRRELGLRRVPWNMRLRGRLQTPAMPCRAP